MCATASDKIVYTHTQGAARADENSVPTGKDAPNTADGALRIRSPRLRSNGFLTVAPPRLRRREPEADDGRPRLDVRDGLPEIQRSGALRSSPDGLPVCVTM